MHDLKFKFRIPDTLPPLTLREVRNWLWLGFTGLLIMFLSLFPKLVPSPWSAVLVLTCWLALPVRGLFRRPTSTPPTSDQKRIKAQVQLYTFIVVVFGAAFTFWARRLGLAWPIIMGALFFIEALPSVIAALTEWWRLSTIGISIGLMICGFGFPFVSGTRTGVLMGGAVFFGCSLSAMILYWQVRSFTSIPPKEPNQSPEPTTMAVTHSAAQTARQP